jgi:MmgE/PrpD C-terminal domain
MIIWKEAHGKEIPARYLAGDADTGNIHFASEQEIDAQRGGRAHQASLARHPRSAGVGLAPAVGARSNFVHQDARRHQTIGGDWQQVCYHRGHVRRGGRSRFTRQTQLRSVPAVRSKVTLLGDDEMAAAMPARQCRLSLKLKDGRELNIHVKAVLGTAQNPMTRAQVDEKCFHLMTPILGKARTRKLCDAVWAIDTLKDVRQLRQLLAA